MENEKFVVYAKTNDSGCIVSVNSSAFVSDDWGVEIDRGTDYRHHHAQGNYFPGGLYTEDGVPRYKLQGGQPVERTIEEIQQDLEILISNTPLSNDLQTKLAIAELAELENAHNLENKLAIAELAELLLGGDK